MKHLNKAVAAVILLGVLGGAFFARTSSAQSGTIDIPFDNDTFGKVSQSLGLVGSGITAQNAQEMVSAFGQTPIYIKLVNPSTASLAAPQFQTLSNAGYKWYFLFTQNTSVTLVLDTYRASQPLTNLVVELETVDAGFIQSLKTNYPGVRIHAGNLPVWPRSRVNEIYSVVQPPAIEGVSFWIGTINKGSVFSDIKLTFDTFYDASKAIAGEKVNHPANAILSVSDTQYPPYTTPNHKTAYMSGLISSTIITSVQSQAKSGQAPIRYIVPGTFSEFSSQERVLLRHFAQFLAREPDVVWPEAIGQNGDPWDNSFLSGGNTKPIVGVIGKISSGFYGFLTNSADVQVVADLKTRVDFGSHKAYSVLANAEVAVTNGQIPIGAYDTIVVYPSNLPGITPPQGGNPTATLVPDQPTPTTSAGGSVTPTTVQLSCDQQRKIGDFNCSGGVEEADFTAWRESFAATNSSLAFFEYWRRAFYR